MRAFGYEVFMRFVAFCWLFTLAFAVLVIPTTVAKYLRRSTSF